MFKENPQLVGQAMGSLGGGEKRPQQEAPSDAQPGVDGVRHPVDAGDKGYDGIKNIAKTVASFWFGGAAGALGKGGAAAGGAAKAGSAAGGASGAAAAGGTSSGWMGNAVQQGVGLGMNNGQAQQPQPTYAQSSQSMQQQPWLQRWGQGFGNG